MCKSKLLHLSPEHLLKFLHKVLGGRFPTSAQPPGCAFQLLAELSLRHTGRQAAVVPSDKTGNWEKGGGAWGREG